MKLEPIEEGYYYHIYNQGINKENIFITPDNYLYFLKLYKKYIYPVSRTLAWCLMPNHFHFLIYIKTKNEIKLSEFNYSTVNSVNNISASKQLSYLFNAYSQAFNKQNQRTGSLFKKPFRRKKITSQLYLQQLICYIHNNPVHHDFTENIEEYKWTSYKSIISKQESGIDKNEVIELFGDIENFKYYHKIYNRFDDKSDYSLD